MIEDYRAGLGIDRLHDEEDRRQGKVLQCPMLSLWSLRDDLEALYGDVLAVWRPWAPDLRGHGIDSGHHMAEEAPEVLAAELLRFINADTPASTCKGSSRASSRSVSRGVALPAERKWPPAMKLEAICILGITREESRRGAMSDRVGSFDCSSSLF
ncbi:hypothetical protein J2Y55_003248 [Bosea sp. BE125]|uniref:alpha/beta fold hydrolase n=1 Tax=Bosea sp. BE125 TaxID=2817909 RepID=UPI0028570904|nr:hypothetical protein [Bosea sp. BE125]